jgi:hypothetical protein
MFDKQNNKEFNVILDLDNTIICAVEIDYYKKNKDKMGLLDTNLKYEDFDNAYRIYQRPHLEEFLTFVFRNFNVAIFTAASKDYGLFILDNIIRKIIPDQELSFFFYDYHTDLSRKYYNSPKDLRLLWHKFPTTFEQHNTIIIDDLKDVKVANGFNCINIKEFDVIDENYDDEKDFKVNKHSILDNELLNVIECIKLMML